MLETVGYFLFGAGIGIVLYGCVLWFTNLIQRRKFNKFIESIKEMGALRAAEAAREVSELSFRDRDGVMNTVRIVIDPNMDMLTDEEVERARSVLDGNPDPDLQVGTIGDLLAGHKIEESAMEKIQEFVFSAKAVHDMRMHGIEPDEVVTKMLRASGRMAE